METEIKKGLRIYYHKGLKKYMVSIAYRGENIHIGYFEDFDEAVKARDEAFKRLFNKDVSEKVKKPSRYEQVLKEKEEKEREASVTRIRPDDVLKDII